ncbi:MAG: BrnT family toxin [Acetobacteraceae bacterium]|nr:BrnT family toxin [Acetobacteraceae bacterium]
MSFIEVYTPPDFEWDDAKSQRNALTRALPFDLAIELFEGPIVVQTDNRRDYGETRTRTIGTVNGLVLVCVYTDRGSVRRIISLRDANRRERDAYRDKVRC